MKFLILFAFFLTAEAMAFDVCKFQDTNEFQGAVEAKKIQKIAEAKNHKAFNPFEKKLIHQTITSDTYFKNATVAQALRVFGDYYENSTEEGSNSGSISYYRAGAKVIVLVHYWPGDNEVGAFLEVFPNGKTRVLATISDQWMTCR
ncbi:MAG TPA: hypothetical protein VNJ01_09985 [Bacteriovoracaceae bacterium]|nr:hypothetical protein [Bacteriovoracaceae bacterium]